MFFTCSILFHNDKVNWAGRGITVYRRSATIFVHISALPSPWVITVLQWCSSQWQIRCLGSFPAISSQVTSWLWGLSSVSLKNKWDFQFWIGLVSIGSPTRLNNQARAENAPRKLCVACRSAQEVLWAGCRKAVHVNPALLIAVP